MAVAFLEDAQFRSALEPSRLNPRCDVGADRDRKVAD
jgi:hypothetical protein